jgi:hypothetical protein
MANPIVPASDQTDFLKKIQDHTFRNNIQYSLSDFITNQADFFIGKEGGPNKLGGDLYIGSQASEANYKANVRNPRGHPMNPSPFRLRIKVAVLLDPSGPIVGNTPQYIIINRKKGKRGLQRVNRPVDPSQLQSIASLRGQALLNRIPITGPRQAVRNASNYFYSDFPKGSASQEQCIIKDTSADVTGPLASWPALEKIIQATAYSEVREEARLSELDWTITGLYPQLLCEGHAYEHGIDKWNLFFIVFGTITDHIRLYQNNAQVTRRASAMTFQNLSDQLTDRASADLISDALGKSYKERGTVQVVKVGTTDPNTWLEPGTHESLIYRDFMGLG